MPDTPAALSLSAVPSDAPPSTPSGTSPDAPSDIPLNTPSVVRPREAR
ncbi:hypothetical protein ACFVT9_01200 [Kitasatospora cineracea]